MTTKKKKKPEILVSRPSRYPQRISDDVWYYEEGRSLHFLVSRNGPESPSPIQFKVPGMMVKHSLERRGYL